LVKSNQTARFNAGKQNKTNPEFFVSLEMSEHQQTNRQRTQLLNGGVSDDDEKLMGCWWRYANAGDIAIKMTLMQ